MPLVVFELSSSEDTNLEMTTAYHQFLMILDKCPCIGVFI